MSGKSLIIFDQLKKGALHKKKHPKTGQPAGGGIGP
jgi:hypothetical protein